MVGQSINGTSTHILSSVSAIIHPLAHVHTNNVTVVARFGLRKDIYFFTPPPLPTTVCAQNAGEPSSYDRTMAQSVSIGSGYASCKPLHAVVFALPFQGHFNPAFHLTNKLAAKGVIVTFVHTEAFPPALHPTSHLPSNPFHVRYAQVSDGLPLDFDRSLNRDKFAESFINKMPLHAEELLLHLNRKGPPISCIIADTFFVWMPRVAKKFEIPLLSLWTEPATVFSIFYHLHLLRQNGHYASPRRVEDEEIIDYLPGVTPSLRVVDLPSYLQEADTSTLVHTIITQSFEAVREADWVISNTVYELEASAIDGIQSRIPFWSVGPLLPPEYMKQQEEGLIKEEYPSSIGTSMWPESDCTQWLDSKPRQSVVYVSFGSYANVSKSQIHEMAMGLVESQQSFVWALRPDIVASDVSDILPGGFLDEIKEQGVVVPWASQLQVLSHPSVGGFLSHCGWNSILESIWLGIPMLAFPLVADQYTNCKLITEEWRVAVRLGGSSRSINNSRALVGRDVIGRSVKEFMGGREGKEARRRVERMRDVLHTAATKGGSSYENLDHLLERIKLKANQRGGARTRDTHVVTTFDIVFFFGHIGAIMG